MRAVKDPTSPDMSARPQRLQESCRSSTQQDAHSYIAAEVSPDGAAKLQPKQLAVFRLWHVAQFSRRANSVVPLKFHASAITVNDQIASCGKTMNTIQVSILWVETGSEHQEVSHRRKTWIDTTKNAHKLRQFRTKEKLTRVAAIEQRLHPKAVATTEELAFNCVVDRERPHSLKSFHAGPTPLGVRRKHHFRISIRRECAPGSTAPHAIRRSCTPAVVRNCVTTSGHRLRTTRAEVENRQSCVPQRHSVLLGDSKPVRPGGELLRASNRHARVTQARGCPLQDRRSPLRHTRAVPNPHHGTYSPAVSRGMALTVRTTSEKSNPSTSRYHLMFW